LFFNKENCSGFVCTRIVTSGGSCPRTVPSGGSCPRIVTSGGSCPRIVSSGRSCPMIVTSGVSCPRIMVTQYRSWLLSQLFTHCRSWLLRFASGYCCHFPSFTKMFDEAIRSHDYTFALFVSSNIYCRCVKIIQCVGVKLGR